MLSTFRAPLLQAPIRRTSLRCCFSTSRYLREAGLSIPQTQDYEAKYAEKLEKRAQEQGKSVAELRSELEAQEKERRRQRLLSESQKASASATGTAPSSSDPNVSRPNPNIRKDSSPVKPLNDILNLERLLKKPHTTEQLSLLWRAYHSSRTDGTGRGFLSASVPLDTYQKMLSVAKRYPTFVVPIPRPGAQGADKPAYEFFFMQWGFHGAPPEPSIDIFAAKKPSSNSETSTILFTPLQEYKLRGSFATPYLVITHYGDLASSHKLVLLRGEITPSSSGASAASPSGENDDRYLLSQHDAQLLAIVVQRFYLWSEGENERTALLQAFHDKPEEFSWEDLLKHTDYAS